MGNFFKYNNAFPIILIALFLITGSTFAASETLRDAVIGEKVVEISGVDNEALINLDIERLNQSIEIVYIEENEEKYVLTYDFWTFDLKDYFWGNVLKRQILKVNKEALGRKDLGLYAEKELNQVMEAQERYLAKAKEKAKETGLTKPKETIKYTKLLGLALSSKTKTIEGYEPVEEKNDDVKRLIGETESDQTSDREIIASDEKVVGPSADDQNSDDKDTDTQADTESGVPVIGIKGNNPTIIDVGTTYNDLGATYEDEDLNLGIRATVREGDTMLQENIEIGQINLDTSTSTTYTITYSVTDTDGKTGEATRTVIVGNEQDTDDQNTNNKDSNATSTSEIVEENTTDEENVTNEEEPEPQVEENTTTEGAGGDEESAEQQTEEVDNTEVSETETENTEEGTI